jgi:hypothetical protein
MTTVWVSPSATAYSCLCERCMEVAREAGLLFSDALTASSVRGSIAAETDVAVARCASGHEITLRRVERPRGMSRPDGRQLQITV